MMEGFDIDKRPVTEEVKQWHRFCELTQKYLKFIPSLKQYLAGEVKWLS